jgi:hypothetical protein
VIKRIEIGGVDPMGVAVDEPCSEGSIPRITIKGSSTDYRFRGGRKSICSFGVALMRTWEASGRCGENFSSSQAIPRATATAGIKTMRANTSNARGHSGGTCTTGRDFVSPWSPRIWAEASNAEETAPSMHARSMAFFTKSPAR